MANWLKQSTNSTVVLLGPFVSTADGKTPMTGLTINQGNIQIWKQGGTSLNTKNEVSGATHRGNGFYTTTLDNTDTNTLGQLTVSVDVATALPVWRHYQVVDANTWDSFMSTDTLNVDVVRIDGLTNPAVRLAVAAGVMVPGTVATGAFSPTTTAFEASDITEATADHYIGRVVVFSSGVLKDQATTITDYALVGANGRFTVTAMTEAPGNLDRFLIV